MSIDENATTSVVESWRQLTDLASQYLETGLPFAFRGQADRSWNLSPSLMRVACSTDPAELLEIEQESILEFKAQAHLVLDPAEIPQPGEPEVSWWALMRHHGAPTRLLDWTHSAFVAAYFAVDHLPNADGAVFVVDIQAIEEGLNDSFAKKDSGLADAWPQLFDPNARQRTFFWQQNVRRPARVVAQQGLFSICQNVACAHESMLRVANMIAFRPRLPPSARWIIPANAKKEVLRGLRSASITARSLFPGADGLGRSIAELALLGRAPKFDDRFKSVQPDVQS
jgi:hypothetical protein